MNNNYWYGTYPKYITDQLEGCDQYHYTSIGDCLEWCRSAIRTRDIFIELDKKIKSQPKFG